MKPFSDAWLLGVVEKMVFRICEAHEGMLLWILSLLTLILDKLLD